MLVAGTLWRELGLQHVLDREGGRGVSDGVALADRALVLVGNRLCAPTSEHGLARWLETDFVCDRRGRRWLPQWRADAERRASRRPRVRVSFRQLKGGIGRWTSWPRGAWPSNTSCICGCAISSRSRWIACSTT